MNYELKEAIKVLKNGGIVIYPTDTAFGIGCRMDDRSAVDRLFRIRKRPRIQATPVLVSSIDQALPYLDSPSDIVRHLMDRYWPGALTIVSKCKKDQVYSPIRGGRDTIGIRMPDHSDIRMVIAEVGVPILGPSANIHGEKTPFFFEHLDPSLVNQADYVLPGSCKRKIVSTVVDLSHDPYTIVRQGAITLPEKPVILSIDSSKRHETAVSIRIRDVKKEKKFVSCNHSSQKALPLIESLFAENNLSFRDIIGIELCTGPGSFTGLRVGTAIGMTLGWLLGVPVNGQPVKAPPPLDYGQDRWGNSSH